MDLTLIKAVYAIVMGKPGHPNQFLYIDSWLGITQDTAPPTQWARFYAHGGGGKILMAQKVTRMRRKFYKTLKEMSFHHRHTG